MPRPKGSRNKPKNGEAAVKSSAVGKLGALEQEIEKLTEEAAQAAEEVSAAEEALKARRAELKKLQKDLASAEKKLDVQKAAAEEEQRIEQAKEVAAAFLKSGKSADEVIALLKDQQ